MDTFEGYRAASHCLKATTRGLSRSSGPCEISQKGNINMPSTNLERAPVAPEGPHPTPLCWLPGEGAAPQQLMGTPLYTPPAR